MFFLTSKNCQEIVVTKRVCLCLYKKYLFIKIIEVIFFLHPLHLNTSKSVMKDYIK